MDLDRLLQVCDEYVDALNGHLWARLHNEWDEAEEQRQRALRALPASQEVARVIRNAPDPSELIPDGADGYAVALDAALRLQGAIVAHRDLADALRDDGPELSSRQLHPWVREAAASLWRDGHYRQAVHAAASVIDEHLQAKLGRVDLYGAALARQAFSSADAQPDQPRLRFVWLTPGTDTYKSAHDGARELGTACAHLIRNTAAHRTEQLSERVALEQLATLSYWARLITNAQVVKGPAAGP